MAQALRYTLMQLHRDCQQLVNLALKEDIATGDISANLIAKNATSRAQIICKEKALIAGSSYVDFVFSQLGSVQIKWHISDHKWAQPHSTIATLEGNTRALLTGERTALNLLQTLSGTATATANFVATCSIPVFDTRKTLPGLRRAQKYAVAVGGGCNHRMGLYDAYLLKENHIAALGSIKNAVATARRTHPDKKIEIEVRNFKELQQGLNSKVNIIMLDNFSPHQITEAAKVKNAIYPQCLLEYSGNLDRDTIAQIPPNTIDYISIGAITKNVKAIDLSMLL